MKHKEKGREKRERNYLKSCLSFFIINRVENILRRNRINAL